MKIEKAFATVPGIKKDEAPSWPGLNSRFGLIIVAGLRSKQLLQGSTARIENDQRKRRHTSIAIEETRKGLVPVNLLKE